MSNSAEKQMASDGLAKKAKAHRGRGTRDRILDAAELEFSTRGYESCSLRTISASHNVNLGLIHYYFGGKEQLFTAVFLRRSKALVKRRRALLGEALKRSSNQPLAVSEIVGCFVAPSVEMIKAGEGPRAYIRLQGMLRTDPSDFARKLRNEAFSSTNRIFIRELERSCPHLSRASVVWRFSAMVGAFYALVSQTGRVKELSDGLAQPDDIHKAFAEVVRFVAGGFCAEALEQDLAITDHVELGV